MAAAPAACGAACDVPDIWALAMSLVWYSDSEERPSWSATVSRLSNPGDALTDFMAWSDKVHSRSIVGRFPLVVSGVNGSEALRLDICTGIPIAFSIVVIASSCEHADAGVVGVDQLVQNCIGVSDPCK